MKTLSLFKLHAVVTIILTLTGFSTLAQTATPNLQVGISGSDYAQIQQQSSCLAAREKASEALSKVTKACSETGLGSDVVAEKGKSGCFTAAKQCEEDLIGAEEDADLGIADMLASMTGGSTGTGSEVDRIAAKCPIAKGSDTKAALRDVKKDVESKQKDIEDLKKEMLEKKEKYDEELASLNEQISELKDSKVKEDADRETSLTEAQAQARDAINKLKDTLMELNTQIIKAQAGKADTLTAKAKALAGMTDQLMSISCQNEVKAKIAGTGKKTGSTSSIIKQYGQQMNTKKELYSKCLIELAAERRSIIEKHNAAIQQLDDEISKTNQRMQQAGIDLQKAQEATAQLTTQNDTKKTAAQTKYDETLQRLQQKITNLYSNFTQYNQNSQVRLNQLQASLTQQSSELSLLERQKKNNTYTVSEVTSLYSDYKQRQDSADQMCGTSSAPSAPAASGTPAPSSQGGTR